MVNEIEKRARPDAGFTMVEVIVAMMILTIGVLGLAGTTAFVVRQVTGAKIATQRTAALQTAVEQMNAISYANLSGTGADTIGNYAMSWSVADMGTSKLVTFVSTGPGLVVATGNMTTLRPDVADTFTYRRIRP